MPEPETTPTATVVAKVIRADGTEETYVSEDVSVSNADAVSEALEVLNPPDEGGQ